MPILFEKQEENAQILVFKIAEDDEFYRRSIDFTEADSKEFNEIKHPDKQRQWLASRYLLKKITGENRTLFVKKSDLGKPHFTNHEAHFSISHSRDCIALIYSLTRNVAIDIEKLQPKIEHIRKKFLHPKDFEQGTDLVNLTLIWSVKEAIYKYFHTKELYSFKENIAVLEKNEMHLFAEVELSNTLISIKLSYLIIEDFVLVYFQE